STDLADELGTPYVNVALARPLLQAGDGPSHRPRPACLRPARRPALSPQVPAPVSRRLPRPDLPGLGARLQVGDAPALGGGAAAARLPQAASRRRLRRGGRARGARGAAIAARHAVLVR